MKQSMPRAMAAAALALCILCALCACAASPEAGGAEGGSAGQAVAFAPSGREVKIYPLPTENVMVAVHYSEYCAASMGGYYFCTGQYLRHRSVGSKESVAMCVQAGCEHRDSSCHAYMGGSIQQIAEYHGLVYALVRTDEEDWQIVCNDPSGGEQETLLRWEWTHSEDGLLVTTQITLLTLAYGKLYYRLDRTTYAADTMQLEKEEALCMEYDLATNTERALPIESFACVGEAGYVSMERESYFNEETEETVILRSELRLYDPHSWEYTVIAERERDGYISPTDPAYRYGDLVCYLCENTLYTFDAQSGQARALLTPQEPVVNFWLMDNKIFYITRNESGEYRYYYADLSDCEPIQLENNGDTGGMVYSVSEEGMDYFTNHNGKVLSKQDFYAERYE